MKVHPLFVGDTEGRVSRSIQTFCEEQDSAIAIEDARAKALLLEMLACDFYTRITARKALEHSYFGKSEAVVA